MKSPEISNPNPDVPIGIRPLTLGEQIHADMLGLKAEIAHTVTPAELDKRADALIDNTNVHWLLGA